MVRDKKCVQQKQKKTKQQRMCSFFTETCISTSLNHQIMFTAL